MSCMRCGDDIRNETYYLITHTPPPLSLNGGGGDGGGGDGGNTSFIYDVSPEAYIINEEDGEIIETDILLGDEDNV